MVGESTTLSSWEVTSSNVSSYENVAALVMEIAPHIIKTVETSVLFSMFQKLYGMCF